MIYSLIGTLMAAAAMGLFAYSAGISKGLGDNPVRHWGKVCAMAVLFLVNLTFLIARAAKGSWL